MTIVTTENRVTQAVTSRKKYLHDATKLAWLAVGLILRGGGVAREGLCERDMAVESTIKIVGGRGRYRPSPVGTMGVHRA